MATQRPLLAQLGPIAQLRAGRMPRRLSQLMIGLVLYGLTLALLIRAGLGNAPWDVLHQGLSLHLPMTIGQAVIIVSVIVLVLWIPLREIPGLGTVLNAIVIGLAADVFLAILTQPEHLVWQLAMVAAGVGLNGVATGLYIGAQLGTGPRDGLMTGLNRRTGISIRLVRTSLEVAVVVVGWLLGGVVGIGTVIYALAIGPLTQLLLPPFIVALPSMSGDGEAVTHPGIPPETSQ